MDLALNLKHAWYLVYICFCVRLGNMANISCYNVVQICYGTVRSQSFNLREKKKKSPQHHVLVFNGGATLLLSLGLRI